MTAVTAPTVTVRLVYRQSRNLRIHKTTRIKIFLLISTSTCTWTLEAVFLFSLLFDILSKVLVSWCSICLNLLKRQRTRASTRTRSAAQDELETQTLLSSRYFRAANIEPRRSQHELAESAPARDHCYWRRTIFCTTTSELKVGPVTAWVFWEVFHTYTNPAA